MSSDFQDPSEESAKMAAQGLRLFTSLSASLFRAAAARIGMTVTDIQVIDILEATGSATPGELAELTGLTSGAIAGMLNRLEETGLLRRERDPGDGRRVIVRIDPASERMLEIGEVFQSLKLAWDETVSQFDEAQTALIAEFLRRSNATSRAEITRLRDAPAEGEPTASAPLEGVSSGQLTVSGATELRIKVDREMSDLYRARFEGTSPEVKVNEGDVSIRYPRRLSSLFGAQRSVLVTLGATIPWEITVHGGAAMITAELSNLMLSGFEAKGGASMVKLELPVPSAAVPVRLSGGASEIIVRRPAGVAVRAHLKGWATHFGFDEQSYDAIGNDVVLQSTDFDPAGPYFAVEIASSASSVTISTV
ncbi:MAG TPA: MarR family winged helix-turn-helix transcriptional regulator [Spirochaetia bacterium]|nr:MarR family winged helix-turn-helix transcriptional regulator [Spirochaetia bacterium]